MPQFPIQYSQQRPPAAGQNVPARLDTATGDDRVGAALASAGGRLADMGLQILGRIQDAEDSTELDTFRRKYGEAYNALEAALDVSTDPAADQKAIDQFSRDVSAYASKRDRVNRQWQHYLATALPDSQGKLQWRTMKKRREILKAQDGANDEADYLSGNKENFAMRRQKAVALGTKIKEEADKEIAEFDAESALAINEKRIYGGDPMQVQQAADALDAMKTDGMTVEQTKRMAHLKAVAAQQNKHDTQAAWAELVTRIHEASKLEPAKRDEALAQAEALIGKTPGTREDRTVLYGLLEKAREGKDAKSDPVIEAAIASAVVDLDIGTTPEKRQNLQDLLYNSLRNKTLSPADYVRLKTDLAKTVSADKARIVSEMSQGMDGEYTLELRRKAAQEDMTPEKLMEEAARMKAIWPKPKKKELSQHAQTILGMLITGDPKVGIISKGEAKKLGFAEGGNLHLSDYFKGGVRGDKPAEGAFIAVKYLLNELGLNWQDEYPQAVETLIRHFPSKEARDKILTRADGTTVQWPPKAGSTQATTTEVPKRLPGETIEAYLRRTGK